LFVTALGENRCDALVTRLERLKSERSEDEGLKVYCLNTEELLKEQRRYAMKMHYLIRRIAGTFVLVSLALGYWVSPWFFLFTAFVGVNLIQSSFTQKCPMESILQALGIAESDDSAAKVQQHMS